MDSPRFASHHAFRRPGRTLGISSGLAMGIACAWTPPGLAFSVTTLLNTDIRTTATTTATTTTATASQARATAGVENVPLVTQERSRKSAPPEAAFFVFGGGPTARESGAAIERNVLRLLGLIAARPGGNSLPPTVHFGSGPRETPTPDVAEIDTTVPSSELWVSSLFQRSPDVALVFRKNAVQGVVHESTRARVEDGLKAWLADPRTRQGRIYFSGHGGLGAPARRGDTDATRNVVHLWEESRMSVQEFAMLLNQHAHDDGRIQVVMPQCYGGGFAQILYADGMRGSAYARTDRCGFFAQLPDRLAAGCSNDASQDKEYSRYFFEALDPPENATRPAADADADGQVSAMEAHAYAIAHDDSIDVPVTTSVMLLRWDWPRGLAWKPQVVRESDLTPWERAALTRLAARLRQPFATLLASGPALAERSVKSLGATHKAQQARFAELDRSFDDIVFDTIDSFSGRYPFVRTPYARANGPSYFPSPDKVDAFKGEFLKSRHYKAMEEWGTRRAQNDARLADIEHEEALWQRVSLLVEHVKKRKALRKASSRHAVLRAQFERLVACESAPFL